MEVQTDPLKVFIVHAHPEEKSFCAAMQRVAVEEFEGQGHEVRVSDLYAMKFNPVASKADFNNPSNPHYCSYALEQRHGVETGTISEDIQEELEKLLWCDLLVLNFPIFWFSTPAILKGWIDRVLVSGKIYGGRRFYDFGGLAGKRVLVNVTIGGQEHMFNPDGVHGPLQLLLSHLLRGTLAYTGLQVLSPFIAWHVPYISHNARCEILKKFKKRLASIGSDTPLEFQSLNNFDENMRPISNRDNLFLFLPNL